MLFAELDISLINKLKTVKWLSEMPEHCWFFDAYRNCFMLPVMTKNGGIKKSDVQHRNSSIGTKQFLWTDFVPSFIKSYFEKNIFSWTKTKSRIIILKTTIGEENPIHIDCSPQAFNTVQHKLRIIVQGTSDSLYFETRNGKIWAPYTEKPFIMDGSWPHGMINSNKVCKYTICFGSPWTKATHYPGLNTLLSIDRKQLPKCYMDYFHKSYREILSNQRLISEL